MLCNILILFFCTKVLLMMTGQSTVHYQTNFVISVIFVPPGVFPWSKKIILICYTYSGKAWHWIPEDDVQWFVVLHQRMSLVMINQLNNRSERQRLDEAEFAVLVQYFYQLITVVLPVMQSDKYCKLLFSMKNMYIYITKYILDRLTDWYLTALSAQNRPQCAFKMLQLKNWQEWESRKCYVLVICKMRPLQWITLQSSLCRGNLKYIVGTQLLCCPSM